MYCGLSAVRPIRAIIDRGEVTYEGVHYIIIIICSYDYSLSFIHMIIRDHYYHDHYCWSIYHNGEVS